MRIDVLTHGTSPFGFEYARAFQRHGHTARVLSMGRCSLAAPGVESIVLGEATYDPGDTASRRPYLGMIRPLRRLVRDDPSDVLFAMFLCSGGVLGWLSGHPHLVPSAHGSDVVTHVDRRLWRWLYRRQIRRALLVHAVSEPLRETLVGRLGVRPDDLLIYPVGVDPDRLPYIDPAERPGAGEILCTRGHRPVYGQDTLVRAAARLKERQVAFRLTFAHPGEVERTRAMVHAAGLDDRVTYLPGYTIDGLPALMRQADVYVSASRSDGTSISLLEALCTGTFPVVSDIPANRPWIRDGENGLLFPVDDDAACADRLEQALARPDIRAQAGPGNRQMVLERGNMQVGAKRLLDAFEQRLGR